MTSTAPSTATVLITAVHLSSGGTRHEHITSIRWQMSQSSKTGSTSVPDMVTFIDDGNEVATWDGRSSATVGVVRPAGRPAYLRTFANGEWTDNLLHLPRY